jgi:hypothetical protein
MCRGSSGKVYVDRIAGWIFKLGRGERGEREIRGKGAMAQLIYTKVGRVLDFAQ